MKRVAIIGGHTEWAKSLQSVITDRGLDLEIRAYTSSEDLGSDEHLLGPETLEFADILVLATDGELALGIAKGALKLGKRILDLVGATRNEDEARYVWPMLDGGAASADSEEHFALIANGLASPIVAVLRALSSRKVLRLGVATYESAAGFGRPGMDELLDQCRAVCALQEPKAEVFSEQLAFNAMPLSTAEADAILTKEIKAGLEGLNIEPAMNISRVLVPTFSAEAAVLHLELGTATTEAQVRESLKAARGLQVPKETASAQAALERDDALVSRIQVDDKAVKLWLCIDRLRRGSATPAALLLERWAS